MPTPERIIIEKMIKIVNKDSEVVPFTLNKAQAELDENLSGRDIVPKSRQQGISSYFLARYTVKSLGYKNQRSVLISHDNTATQKMLAKVHFFIENMEPRPTVGYSSKNEITFPKTGSSIYIGTAGSRQFGRGDTIHNLHCSEVAFWPDPKSLLTGLFQAVPKKTGEIAIESTGNGQGNFYHRACMRAASGLSRYRMHFFGWLTDPDCRSVLTPARRSLIMGNLTDKEKELMLLHGASIEQIAFRREKIFDDFDEDEIMFDQEYPTVLKDCFQATGFSLFSNIKHVEDKDRWKRIGPGAFTLEGHPKKDHRYILGADVAGGVGADRSVIEIVDIDEDCQAFEFISDRIAPDDFGVRVAETAKLFNNAYVIPEINNHGLTTVAKLRDIYPNHLIHHEPPSPDEAKDGKGGSLLQFGIRTTVKTKPLIVNSLRVFLRTLTIYSQVLNSELATFIEKENGKLEAEEGSFDDCVMAMGMIAKGYNRACMMLGITEKLPKRERRIEDNPFSLDAIIAELRDRRTGYPIADQHSVNDFGLHTYGMTSLH